MMTREKLLADCAIRILNDVCPPDPDQWYCKRSEEYDDEICTRCWMAYLYRVLNEGLG